MQQNRHSSWKEESLTRNMNRSYMTSEQQLHVSPMFFLPLGNFFGNEATNVCQNCLRRCSALKVGESESVMFATSLVLARPPWYAAIEALANLSVLPKDCRAPVPLELNRIWLYWSRSSEAIGAGRTESQPMSENYEGEEREASQSEKTADMKNVIIVT